MKKVRIFAAILLTVMLLLCLCGCVSYEAPNGQVYGIVDPWREVDYSLDSVNSVLEYDGVKYPYEVTRENNRITYSITYPGGVVYTETREGDTVQSGWAGERDMESPSGDTLVGILDDYYYLQEFKPNFLNWFGALLMIPMGIFVVFFPRAAWELEHMFKSWQYQSIEPSDDGLLWTRFGGILCVIMGVIFFFMKWH